MKDIDGEFTDDDRSRAVAGSRVPHRSSPEPPTGGGIVILLLLVASVVGVYRFVAGVDLEPPPTRTREKWMQYGRTLSDTQAALLDFLEAPRLTDTGAVLEAQKWIYYCSGRGFHLEFADDTLAGPGFRAVDSLADRIHLDSAESYVALRPLTQSRASEGQRHLRWIARDTANPRVARLVALSDSISPPRRNVNGVREGDWRFLPTWESCDLGPLLRFRRP